MSQPRRLALNIVLIFLVIAALAFVTARDAYVARRLTYELTPSALVIRYRNPVSLPYDEIKSVTFLREPPQMQGSWFASMGRVRLGLYRIQGIGLVEVYSADAKRPLIVVRKGHSLYGLTPREGEAFHRTLLERLPAHADEPPVLTRE